MHSNLPIAVISVIIKDNKILLLKRQNTPWMNGYWGVPGGRLDIGESMTYGATRELKEEVGIDINQNNILFKSLVQHKDDRGERIYFIIYINNFEGTPTNMEPDKCSGLEWFNVNNLPENITPQVKISLNCIKNKINFLEYGY